MTASGAPRLQIFLISTGCIVKRRIRRFPCLRMKWDSRTRSETICSSPEATAAPIMPIWSGKMKSQSRKILDTAPAYIPTKDRVGDCNSEQIRKGSYSSAWEAKMRNSKKDSPLTSCAFHPPNHGPHLNPQSAVKKQFP